jgi:ATP-dependent Clp protease ATP-binding subunit ClpC
LEKVSERLHEAEIKLSATSAALDRIAEEGYDPEMGARPLRRVIQFKVEDRLSDAVLAEQFKAGDEVVVDVDSETDDIILRKKEETPTEQPMGIGA